VVSVVDSVFAVRGLTSAQLGIWQISADSDRFWIRDYFYWPGALLAMGSALVIGALAARRTARLPERRVGAVASGAAGPLLVAVAYLLAVPRLAAIAAEQVSAHLIAPYAVIAGVGGSALVAVLAQRAEGRTAARVTLPRQRTAEPDDLSGTDREALDLPPVDEAAGSADAAPGTDEPTTGARTGRSGRRPAGATRGTGAARATPEAAAGLAVAEPGTPPGPGTASDRSIPRPRDGAAADVAPAPDPAAADVPSAGEASGTDQPKSGPTTPPTTGPKTRPGRRGR
jgi:hypothetical protein